MPSHYQGSTAEQLALSTYINLVRAANALTAQLHDRDKQLTASQFGVLEALMHLGPLSQKQLAEKLLCTSGNLTAVIDRLEEQKLVTRLRTGTDRRRYEISLTAKGRDLIAHIFPNHASRVMELFSILSKAEQDALRSLCRKLGTGEQKHEN